MPGMIRILVLAVIQGLTEFLPVSSSGHLVLAEALTGFRDQAGGGVLFETVVHGGTLVAVIVFYRGRVAAIVRSLALWAGRGMRSDDEAVTREVKYAGLILLGSLPAGLVGIMLKDSIESTFDSPAIASACMIATGLFLVLYRRDHGGRPIGWRAALMIGTAQAVAILPGCSRSGWTITMAIILGAGFIEAAEFSFLLSIPAVAGALVLELATVSVAGTPGGAPGLLLGAAAAFASGYAALRLLVWILGRGSFHRFSWYLIPVGTVSLIYFIVRAGV